MPTSHAIERLSPAARASAPASPDRLAPAVQRLVAAIPLRARVLEIGCGTGLFAREIAARRGARVTAIDVSARMIEVARVRTVDSLGIEYRVADVLALSPRGFDIVVAIDTLRTLPLVHALERMAGAVISGGRVLVADRVASRVPRWLVGATLAAEPGDLEGMGSLKRQLRQVLPDVAVRRHLGGWYTADWQHP